MEKVYDVFKGERIAFSGEAVEVREWLEDQLGQSSFGIAPMLQEGEDEDEALAINLHSEWEDDLEVEAIEKVIAFGFSEYDALDAIRGILGVDIRATEQ